MVRDALAINGKRRNAMRAFGYGNKILTARIEWIYCSSQLAQKTRQGASEWTLSRPRADGAQSGKRVGGLLFHMFGASSGCRPHQAFSACQIELEKHCVSH